MADQKMSASAPHSMKIFLMVMLLMALDKVQSISES